KKEKATLNLLDINGHQLWQTEKRAEVDEVEVDMRVFSEGVYLLKIVTGDRMTVKRVVVNR
ncbi:MAG: T9SS type A sorting domain-containing protein, partial [Saprospiraceae bacterium]|nr:T9SS type A sorting domain-containing protein [Saprospiraceae bacterium]